MKTPSPSHVTLSVLLLVVGAAAFLAFDHPAPGVNATYTLTFKKPADLRGLDEPKLLAALARSHPVSGSRVFWKGKPIFPPRSREMKAAAAKDTPTVPPGEPGSIHVSQSVGFNDEADLRAFIDGLR